MLTPADTLFAAPQVTEVRPAFDEERAVAEIREQVARKQDARGEYRSAVLEIGAQLLAARRAMPDVPKLRAGGTQYSPQFLAFIEKTGLGVSTAQIYMGYARNPASFEAYRQRDKRYGGSGYYVRRKALTEIRDALLNASKEEVLAAINEELAKKNGDA